MTEEYSTIAEQLNDIAAERNTITKQLITQAVRDLDCHANAAQIYEHVVQTHPTISRATVYRNLARMAETGKLLNIGQPHGAAHYDHNTHEHFHFVCDNCRKVFDVEGDLTKLCQDLETNHGHAVHYHQVLLKGLCSHCRT